RAIRPVPRQDALLDADRRPRRHGRGYSPPRRHAVSPGRNLQDGTGERSGRRRRCKVAGAGRQQLARGRCVHHADHRRWQHQCPDDHDCRKGRRPDSGKRLKLHFLPGTKTMTKLLQCALVASLFALTGCNNKAEIVSSGGDSMPATLQANEKVAQELNLEDMQDFEDAKRGFIARPEGKILDADGNVLVDFDDFKFVEGKAPPTVNPSLWRHAILNAQIGLFKVTDGIYQLRGFDVGNMTLIEGKTGWIVVDALTCRESAAAALAFARKHLGD